jgi:hypothetical protein
MKFTFSFLSINAPDVVAGTRVDPVMRLVREKNLEVGLLYGVRKTYWTIKTTFTKDSLVH